MRVQSEPQVLVCVYVCVCMCVCTGADGVCDIEGDDVQTTNPPLGTMGTYQDEPDGYTHTSRPTNAPGKAQRAPLGPAGARGGGAAAGRGGRGAGRPTKHWVLDGRIYNYAKEGAQECSSREEADKAVQAAQEAAQVRDTHPLTQAQTRQRCTHAMLVVCNLCVCEDVGMCSMLFHGDHV